VELVELYYDCHWTKQGITLVDTPGADSINARHTDVAFQYIRDADAILYVMYYNHAFSRADREFLIQLGRVKDTFSMDKMFFLMNAADLATSDEELEAVVKYLQEQLLQYGIRNPRLFPVSSLLAIQEKQGSHLKDQDSGIKTFEKAFTSFIMKDLLLVSLRQLIGDVRRGTQMLTHLIESAQQSNKTKQERQEKLNLEQTQIIEKIDKWNADSVVYALKKEVEELLYYVNQRVLLRYNDWFVEIYNPSTLRDDGGQIQQRLQNCTLELIDVLKHDLLQELRATSLRLEKWMHQKLQTQLEAMISGCLQVNTELPLSSQFNPMFTTPVLTEPLTKLDMQLFKKALSRFKNAKSFFERNEKMLMRDEIKTILEGVMVDYFKQQVEMLFTYYEQECNKNLIKIKDQIRTECHDYYQSLSSVLSESIDINQLDLIQKQLKQRLLQMEHTIESC
jgi:GTPase Era involved in 16S rRNA processing